MQGIGMRYSLIAMKVILATLLRNYKFTTNLTMADVHMRYEITLKNIRGNMVKVHKRKSKHLPKHHVNDIGIDQ